MPLLAPAALRETLPTKGALLGLDVGTKTIGIAISDPGRSVASPVETIRRTKFSDDVLRLEALIDSRRVIGFVIGLPVALDGSEGPRCQSVRQFAANLMARRDLPTLLWDERFSTAAVERFLVDEADMSRKRRAEVVDKMAAAYILQGALDALNRVA
ncbi:Holliday junction resolvase RuvX [Hypericibacter sp.]|uniref:Holliday junction resolvase RuvX n=1 Tax=Hypericibacter sp. TaxID=2705401 RepID=UPI003D6D862D